MTVLVVAKVHGGMAVLAPVTSEPGKKPKSKEVPSTASLASAVNDAVGRALEGTDGPVSLLFSGGLDSSLLAQVLSTRGRAVELITVGVEGASDLGGARDAAALLNLPWTGSIVTPEETRQAAEKVRAVDASLSSNDLSIQTGLELALRRSHNLRVLCGQGADELFLGYAHFAPLRGGRLAERAKADLHRLQNHDWPLTCRLAKEAGHDLKAPYLDEAFLALVEAIPLESRRKPGQPKALLREVALQLGLPASIAARPKKALQYGSGIYRALAPR